jgi:multidrug transporter EmrE-like cation transporter
VLFGALLLGESITLAQTACLGLILAGVVGLEMLGKA